MLIAVMVILDKVLIGLGSAAMTGLFALGAKYLFLNPADEAAGAFVERIKRSE